MLKLVEIKALAEYKLWLRYSDGVEGEVDLSHLAGEGVFKIWDDFGVFEQASVGSEGEISWPGNVDLCADALYLQVTGKQPEDLFPKLQEPSVRA